MLAPGRPGVLAGMRAERAGRKAPARRTMVRCARPPAAGYSGPMTPVTEKTRRAPAPEAFPPRRNPRRAMPAWPDPTGETDMKIGRDTGHALALAALIVAMFGWLKADIARIDAGLDALRAGLAIADERLAAMNEQLARLEGAVSAAPGRSFAPAPEAFSAPPEPAAMCDRRR